jgi:hypothetical protein
MPDDPEIGDFRAQLHLQRERAVERLSGRLRALMADRSRHGMHSANSRVLQTIPILREEGREVISAMLGELGRALAMGGLNPGDLREATVDELVDTLTALITMAARERLKEFVPGAGGARIDDAIVAGDAGIDDAIERLGSDGAQPPV